MGSKVTELDHLAPRAPDCEGEVEEWTPASGSKANLTNQFGSFFKKTAVSYGSWKPTPAELAKFSGMITFTHFGSTSADVNVFIYVDGTLRQKDWGFLPG